MAASSEKTDDVRVGPVQDAHNCIPDFDPDSNTSLFAVYDGHGGAEVAKYCSQHLPEFIKGVELYKKGKLGEGLQEAFLGFDARLTEDAVVQQLKEMAGVDDDEEDEEEGEPTGHTETDMLVAEANMPIEELMAKYSGAGPPPVTPQIKRLQKDKTASPMLKAKKTSVPLDTGSGDGENKTNTSGGGDSGEAQADIAEEKLENGGEPDNDNNLNVEKELREAESQQTTSETEADIKPDSVNENTNNNEKTGMKPDENGIKAEKDKEVAVDNSCVVKNGQKSVDADSTTDENHVDTVENVSSSSTTEEVSTSKPVQSSSLSSSSTSEEAGSSGSSAPDTKPSGSGCSSSGEAAGSSSAGSSSAGPSGSGIQAGGSGTSGSSGSSKTIVDEEFDSDDDSSEEEEEYNEEDDSDEWEDEDDEEEDEEEGGTISGIFGGKAFAASSEEEGDHNEEPGSDSGCTAVLALLRGSQLVVANAGDSRCVLCRDGQAVDLSVDHKPEDEGERKRIEEAGGKVTSDGRVNGGLNLSRALGDHWYKRNETKEAKDQMISAFPDVEETTLTDKDDFMVVACDGIWNFMTSQEVVDFVKERLKDPAKQKTPSLICEEMFTHCLAPNTMGDGTGCDNMTCIIVVFNKSQTSNKRDTSELDTSATDEKQPEKRQKLDQDVEKEPASTEEASTT